MLHSTRQVVKTILGPRVVARIRRWRHNQNTPESDVRERACHYDFPFVTHEGDVYPCCRVGGCDHLRIGNINDPDLTDRLRRFSEPCWCHGYCLRPARLDERPRGFNIEFSLACQAKCSVCCVEAPLWNQTWDRYDELSRIIEDIEPETLIVQGGEVLVQKESMRWLRELKERRPDLQLNLVTNGNVPVAWADEAELLFSRVIVSFVGFQPETYENNMGLPVDRAMAFTEEIIRRSTIAVAPKFLITPTTIHEINPFLKWALPLGPRQIHVFDAQTVQRIGGNTDDPFWKATIERTARKLRAILVRHRDDLQRNGTMIYFEPPADDLLGIDGDFLEAQQLGLWCRGYSELGWHMPQWEPPPGRAVSAE